MSEHSNISQVLQAFLKGHIEAIVAMVDHSKYFKLLFNLVKLIWKVNYCIFYGFDCNKRLLRQSPQSELSISVVFLYVLLISDRNACHSLALPSACQTLCWRG